MNGIWLDKKTFECIVKNTPLVSIDLIIEYNNKFLLGKRKNKPAKGFYFIPGGRILKGESIYLAFKRISLNELGIEFSIEDADFYGVFEHFYPDSIFGDNLSTHYVVLAYRLNPQKEIKPPKEQHNDYIWLSREEILQRNDVHSYTKNYFKGGLK